MDELLRNNNPYKENRIFGQGSIYRETFEQGNVRLNVSHVVKCKHRVEFIRYTILDQEWSS